VGRKTQKKENKRDEKPHLRGGKQEDETRGFNAERGKQEEKGMIPVLGGAFEGLREGKRSKEKERIHACPLPNTNSGLWLGDVRIFTGGEGYKKEEESGCWDLWNRYPPL